MRYRAFCTSAVSYLFAIWKGIARHLSGISLFIGSGYWLTLNDSTNTVFSTQLSANAQTTGKTDNGASLCLADDIIINEGDSLKAIMTEGYGDVAVTLYGIEEVLA